LKISLLIKEEMQKKDPQ